MKWLELQAGPEGRLARAATGAKRGGADARCIDVTDNR